MPNDRLKSYLHLHLIVFIWGFTAVLGALISIDALPLVWYRMLLASGFVWMYIYWKKFDLRVSRRTLIGFVLAGIVIAVHWLTFFMAIKVSNVSITLAMMSTGALFAAIIEPFYYKRAIIWYEIVLGLLVMIGLFIIFRVEGDYTFGIILALISAFLSALFSMINGKFAQVHRPSVISFYELLSGFLFLTLFLIVTGGFDVAFFQLSSSDWIYMLILASVCTGYAFIASVHVMKFLTPYTVMLTINLEPVYGILLAFFVFGEQEKMSSAFYLGALLILSTVLANGILKNLKKIKSSSRS